MAVLMKASGRFVILVAGDMVVLSFNIRHALPFWNPLTMIVEPLISLSVSLAEKHIAFAAPLESATPNIVLLFSSLMSAMKPALGVYMVRTSVGIS